MFATALLRPVPLVGETNETMVQVPTVSSRPGWPAWPRAVAAAGRHPGRPGRPRGQSSPSMRSASPRTGHRRRRCGAATGATRPGAPRSARRPARPGRRRSDRSDRSATSPPRCPLPDHRLSASRTMIASQVRTSTLARSAAYAHDNGMTWSPDGRTRAGPLSRRDGPAADRRPRIRSNTANRASCVDVCCGPVAPGRPAAARTVKRLMPGSDGHRSTGGTATHPAPPVAFRQFVLKLHSRCDLACDHCYVYTMADQRWRDLPRTMPPEVLDATARRIGEHARAHRLDRVSVILHGGEPLLAGPERVEAAVSVIRQGVAPVPVRMTVQTNAIRLDERYLSLFDRLDVRLSVSLDGDRRARPASARARRTGQPRPRRGRAAAPHRGLPAPVQRAAVHGGPAQRPGRHLSQSARTPAVDDRLPATARHLAHSPARTPGRSSTDPVRALADLGVRQVVPRAGPAGPDPPLRRDHPTAARRRLPPGRRRPESGGGGGGADRWSDRDGRHPRRRLRRAAGTGLHVQRDPFDVALALPAVRAQQSGAAALCATCGACDLRRVCGGGLRTHRWRADNGFDNPSVYCPDLYALIDHIRQTVRRDVATLPRATR